MLEFYPHIIAPLVDAGFKYKPRIKQIHNQPNIIVRTDCGVESTKVQELRDLAQRGKTLFGELRDRSGIEIPNINYVFSEGVNSTIDFFTITDRIYGRNLSELEYPDSETPKFHRLYDLFYSGLFNYTQFKYLNGGDYLCDISRKQCVWGTRMGESMEKLFLVDIDILYASFDKLTGEGEEDLIDYINILYNDLIFDERRRFLGCKFPDARKKLVELVLQLNPELVRKKDLQIVIENMRTSSCLQEGV